MCFSNFTYRYTHVHVYMYMYMLIHIFMFYLCNYLFTYSLVNVYTHVCMQSYVYIDMVQRCTQIRGLRPQNGQTQGLSHAEQRTPCLEGAATCLSRIRRSGSWLAVKDLISVTISWIIMLRI